MNEQTTTPQKTTPPKPPETRKVAPASPDGIRVKELTFVRPGGHDLPGGHGLTKIRALTEKPESNKGWHEVVFEPRLRHHRVIWHPPGNQPIQIAMVPESWGWYIPEE